jgi:hypothetical protein
MPIDLFSIIKNVISTVIALLAFHYFFTATFNSKVHPAYENNHFHHEIIWNALKVSEAVYEDNVDEQKSKLSKGSSSIKSFTISQINGNLLYCHK